MPLCECDDPYLKTDLSASHTHAMHTHQKYRHYALVHRALGNERRIAILAIFWGEGTQTCAMLVGRLGISEPAVSRHLHILLKAGFLKSKRKGTGVEFSLDRKSWVMKYLDFVTN